MKRIGTLTEEERLKLLIEANTGLWSRSCGDLEGKGKRDYYAWANGDVMFVKVMPGGAVHPHSDSGIRTHYVLKTNDKAISYVDGEAFNLELGGIYELDASLEHYSVNGGDTERIHKVVL